MPKVDECCSMESPTAIEHNRSAESEGNPLPVSEHQLRNHRDGHSRNSENDRNKQANSKSAGVLRLGLVSAINFGNVVAERLNLFCEFGSTSHRWVEVHGGPRCSQIHIGLGDPVDFAQSFADSSCACCTSHSLDREIEAFKRRSVCRTGHTPTIRAA